MLPSFLATILGGLILALVFFYIREKGFPLPDVSGEWTVSSETVETSYKPYIGMLLKYKVIIFCEGPSITGTSEKIWESSSKGEQTYTGRHRIRGEICGSIEKKYLSKDKIKIHIVEHGELRDSTSYHDLIVDKQRRSMRGKFYSTAADSKGKVHWKRKGI